MGKGPKYPIAIVSRSSKSLQTAFNKRLPEAPNNFCPPLPGKFLLYQKGVQGDAEATVYLDMSRSSSEYLRFGTATPLARIQSP